MSAAMVEGYWQRIFSLPPQFRGIPLPPPLSKRPVMVIVAVLIGTFISTLSGRFSTFGLADMRGALHASVDEAAWIGTAQNVGQMLIGPISVWLSAVWGPRRVLLWGCMVFGFATILSPLAGDVPSFILLQFLSGLGSGCFIPLTIAMLLRNLPPWLWCFGIAGYALSLELSLNISASLEGWYVEHASWQWIFWQSLPLVALMAAMIARSIPQLPVNRDALVRPDIFGLACCGVGFAMIYAALDQGNRLDWLNSGLIVGLLAGGGLLVIAFLIDEAVSPCAWLDLRAIIFGCMPVLMFMILIVRFSLLSTTFVVPQYLTVVRGFRSLDIGSTLIWVVIPQLFLAPLVALALRFVDPRYTAALGLSLIALACWIVTAGLTDQWGSPEFLPSQLVQAVGQCMALSSVIFLAVLNIKPTAILSFGAAIQIARLLGGELGVAFMATWTRISEQISSATLGWHIQAGAPDTAERLNGLAHFVTPRSVSGVEASSRAVGLLNSAVRTQANVLAYMNDFLYLAIFIICALLVLALIPKPPAGPAAPLSWRYLKGGG